MVFQVTFSNSYASLSPLDKMTKYRLITVLQEKTLKIVILECEK